MKRNTNIEILRFLLMIMIACWHIIIHGYNFINIGTEQFLGNEYLDITLCALFSCAVNCFIFISGYFGISFKIEKIAHLELSLIIISCVCYLSCVCLHLADFNLFGLSWMLLPVSSNKWWFITNYVLLYLLSPLLNDITSVLNQKKVLLIISLLLLYSCTKYVTLCSNLGSDLISMISIFIIGRYFRKYVQISKYQSYIGFFGSWMLLVFCMIVLLKLEKYKLIFTFLGYNNLLIIVMAISLFYIFNNLKKREIPFINYILSPCLFIYLITDDIVIRPLFNAFMVKELNSNLLSGAFYLFLTVITCLIIGLIVNKITSLIIKQAKMLFVKDKPQKNSL